MKKPVKIALWCVGGFFALVLLLVLALPLWIGPVVTTVANSVAPTFTGTDFKMESFSLNPYSGKLSVGGIKLSNPKGYDEPMAFSLESFSIELDTGSLFTDTIHVVDISIEKPFVSYVYDAVGTNNFDRILASVNSKLGTSEAESAPVADEKEGKKEKKASSFNKKFIIDRLAINGTAVKYRMLKIPLPLPTLKDIGKESGGATLEEIVQSVSDSIKKAFSGLGGALGDATKLLETGASGAFSGTTNLLGGATSAAKESTKAVGDGAKAAVSGATDVVKDIGQGATDAVKDIGKGATDAVKDAGKVATDGAKAAAEGARDAIKKVGNLFGK